LHDRDSVQQALRRGISVFEGLVQDYPDDPAYARELGMAWSILAENLFRAGDRREARVCFARSLSIFRETLRNQPDHPYAAFVLANILCGCPDTSLRQPAEALELAETLIQLAPDSARSWLVLGMARYRTGQFGLAVSALQETLRKRSTGTMVAATAQGPSTLGLFFLSMAQWRCGEREAAMKSYQTALRQMQSHFNSRDDEERQACAEAAALLGIREQPGPAANEKDARKR
jgi:tetratricopeptide (TPR) repeat protein